MNTDSFKNTPLAGIGYFLLAMILFAGTDACTKILVAYYPAPLINWVRNLVQIIVIGSIVFPKRGLSVLKINKIWLTVLRSLTLASTSLFAALALRHLPQAETTAVCFAAPLFLALWAKFILHEQIGWVRLIAVLGGFLGVFMVIRPDNALDLTGVVCGLLSALSNSFYQLLSRFLGRTEKATNLFTNSAVIGFLAFSATLPWSWQGPALTPLTGLIFICVGVFAGGGHFLLTRAFALVSASTLAPISYSQLVWSCLTGWLVFNQFPDAHSLGGILVIIVSGVVVCLMPHPKS